MAKSYSPDLLRARVQVHDLCDSGFSSEQIASRLGVDAKKVARWLREPRPNLAPAPLTAWTEQAACFGGDINLFFPEKRGNLSHRKRLAAAICRKCPVQNQCRQTAFANFEQYGIWGGIDFSKLSYGFDLATGDIRVIPREQSVEVA